MPDAWRDKLIDRIANTAATTGAWGYRLGSGESAEATALAVLALSACGRHESLRLNGLKWLATIQGDDGGVPIGSTVPGPCWSTGLAVLAWGDRDDDLSAGFDTNVSAATSWLLSTRGSPIAHDARLFGHDTMLRGWSWVPDTHSWVEPTSYAILALRDVDRASHPHVREGVRLLLDRALPEGGWNYGNTRVLDNVLRPFPATSGIALTALAGEPHSELIDRGIGYLQETLPRVRSPLSVSWGLIGLTAWGARPAEGGAWLAESAARSLHRPANVVYDAMLLLAGAETNRLSHRSNRG